jgi:hypothetical protein
MVRECVALCIAALAPGCSLALDFDDKPPADAAIDGPYTQAECDYKEPNDSVAQAAMIVATDTGPAAICKPAAGSPEDQDFYKLTVASAMVTIELRFTNRPGGDLDMKLFDAAGTMVSQSRGFGDTEKIVCPAASPACPTLTVGADYTIAVFPAVPGSVNNYTFSVTP